MTNMNTKCVLFLLLSVSVFECIDQEDERQVSAQSSVAGASIQTGVGQNLSETFYNLNVDNELTVVGEATFESSVTFEGNVTFVIPPPIVGGSFCGTVNINTTACTLPPAGNTTIGSASSLTTVVGPVTINGGTSTSNTDIGNATGGITALHGNIATPDISEPTTNIPCAPVIIDGSGKLWKAFTFPSSQRYKTNIQKLNPEDTEDLMQLEPCKFKYKDRPEAPEEFGLIAENLLDKGIFLNALRYDAQGRVDSIHYHVIFVAMLNEIIRLRHAVDEGVQERAELRSIIDTILSEQSHFLDA